MSESSFGTRIELYAERADAYARHSAKAPVYVAYERPTMRGFVGDVRGLDVLDLGCGSGDHLEWLNAAGAVPFGVDGSHAMVALAARRVPGATVRQADVTEPLAFIADQSFDLAISSLTFHYVLDWAALLRDVHRLLRPHGRIVISTHNPANPYILGLVPDPSETTLVADRFTFGDDVFDVQYYHRPLSAILRPFVECGFAIQSVVEPDFEGSPLFTFIEAKKLSS